MSPAWKATPPTDDAGYLDRMSQAIFTAGLNWSMVERKWPAFQKAFAGFSPSRVAGLSEREIRMLMKNPGIVRNERKIRATIENARTLLDLETKHGSMKRYLDSFGTNEARLLEDLQYRFGHMGPSTARVFLWMVGYPLTPTTEEKQWMKGHPEHR